MLESPKLTARQQQILELIQSAISRTGAPPTRAEIATELAPGGIGWKPLSTGRPSTVTT